MTYINKTTSPYYTTPVRDFYLDLYKERTIVPMSTDTIVTIPPKFDSRPDLMANEYYGTPRLWWVFAVRNKDVLNDPLEDFKAGLQIFVPSLDTLGDIV